MSNQELERRLTNSSLHPDDQEEIRRIFEILSEKRKLEIFEEWPGLVARMKLRREKMEEERKVFFITYLERIENDLEEYVRSSISAHTHANLQKIQTNL